MSHSMMLSLIEGSHIPQPALSNGNVVGIKALPSLYFHSMLEVGGFDMMRGVVC